MSGPQLVITEQSSLVLEKIGKNGEHKCVHVVVKNTPFQIDLAFANVGPADANTFNFSRINVEAQLVYDCPEQKQVDFVRHTPIEYKAHIDETGTKLSVEMRIKVLTSQLEDMLFRMRLRGIDAVTKQDIPGLYAVTEPIKVVSKQDQVKRIRRQQEAVKSGETVTVTSKRVSGRKRTANDRLEETLARIEASQKQQEALLRRLAGESSDVRMEEASSASTLAAEPMLKCKATGDSSPGFRLADSFSQFLAAYIEIEPALRSVKVRKLVRGASARTVETLSKVVDQLQYELRQESPRPTETASTFVFLNDSAAVPETKVDVDKIDDFYKQFLTLPEMDSAPFTPGLDGAAFHTCTKEASSLFA